MPKALKLGSIVGPSFILLGLGLGSGELVLWPYLVSQFGMGIIWAAVVGISFQFVLNMEIERYTLVTGESVFVGLARKIGKLSPVWFMISTVVPWMWPGIVLSAATVLGGVLGLENTKILAIILPLGLGAILTLGPWIYRTQEIIQKYLILLGTPVVLLLVIVLAKGSDWGEMWRGLLGRGQGYTWLPSGIPMMTFLGALAYSGAGGNLNLVQSFYVKEKGYGMGKYGGKIKSILTGKNEKINLTGKTFALNKMNLTRYRDWWKVINIEHGLVFWATGAVTMVMLALLAYSTVFGNNQLGTGLGFLFEEAKIIGIKTIPMVGVGFLTLAGVMLLSTQLSVFDAVCRIASENLVIFDQEKFRIEKLPKFYYLFLWLEIALSVVVISLGLAEPVQLVVIGAVLNGLSMLIYSILVMWMNLTSLPAQVRPGPARKLAMGAEISFFLVFAGKLFHLF